MINFLPLATRLRPKNFEEFFGQSHLLASGKPLRQLLDKGQLHSMILWGPPGTGKTTLAHLMAQKVAADFEVLSAVSAGVKDIRALVEKATVAKAEGKATVLFIDEIHRFNKSQQDALLPNIESGLFVLVGATTENPSFELNKALLSRARVYVFKNLSEAELHQIIHRALNDKEKGLGELALNIPENLQKKIIEFAQGDARNVLNILEIVSQVMEQGSELMEEILGDVLSTGKRYRFDKKGEDFYDDISALHKSIRGSDPDASLYWLVKMLEGGCDPLYLARRLVRVASEDIGNADPRALTLTLEAWDVLERLGSPEGELTLAQTVIYLAVAPKSNAVYVAYNAAKQDLASDKSLGEVPVYLRNAPTKLMKDLDYGKAYRYPHDEPDAYAIGVHYFPLDKKAIEYYRPTDRGLEIKIKEKLDKLKALNKK